MKLIVRKSYFTVRYTNYNYFGHKQTLRSSKKSAKCELLRFRNELFCGLSKKLVELLLIQVHKYFQYKYYFQTEVSCSSNRLSCCSFLTRSCISVPISSSSCFLKSLIKSQNGWKLLLYQPYTANWRQVAEMIMRGYKWASWMTLW